MMINERKNVRFFVDPRPFAFRRRRQAGGGRVPCSLAAAGPALPAWSCLAIRAGLAGPGETGQGSSLPAVGRLIGGNGRLIGSEGSGLCCEICCVGGWLITVELRCALARLWRTYNRLDGFAKGVACWLDGDRDIRGCRQAGSSQETTKCVSIRTCSHIVFIDQSVRIMYSFLFS